MILNGVRPPPGHVILLQISLQCRQLPRTAPSDDVLLGEARGEDAQHHLPSQGAALEKLLLGTIWQCVKTFYPW